VPLGLYISVPFCRTKCSYCNFASDVFSRVVFNRYVDRVCADIQDTRLLAKRMGGQVERAIDTIYLGGGTPTVLDAAQLERLFAAIRQNFDIQPDSEITVECAPGTLTPGALDTLLRCGVNRVSLGVQSFVDQEAAAVARQHKRTTVLDDISRLRNAGIANLNVDLIAGLPYQTPESWEFSLAETVATGVPHLSVYMLEVDDDSRLGRELIAGGTRYHAHFVPDEDAIADFYLAACEHLGTADLHQYEISNFARDGFESRHNLKYWTRRPYLGFGVDAHSMLRVDTAIAGNDLETVRFSTPDSLEDYVAAKPLEQTFVSSREALEETFFLGLRLSLGLNLTRTAETFGTQVLGPFLDTIQEFSHAGLIEETGDSVRLTPRGRLLSNEVFARFITTAEQV
jgi:oxygen-independent coproporphyrinogen III oxidase